MRAIRFVQPASAQVASHYHETSTICIAVGGSSEDKFSSRTVSLARGSIVFRPAGELHSHSYGAIGFSAVALQVPESVLRRFTERDTAIAKFSPGEGDRQLVTTALMMCADLHFSGNQWDKTGEDLLAEVLGGKTGAGSRRRDTYPNCVRVAMEFIENNYGEPCTYSDVARAAGVHPTHLARLFRQSSDTSIGQYRKRVRLRRAIEHLTRPYTTLADTAQDCGFYDCAHLTHDIRRYLSLSAGDLQKMLRIYKTGTAAVPRVS